MIEDTQPKVHDGAGSLPVRLKFDEGTRIMEKHEEVRSDWAQGNRPENCDLNTYYEVSRTCQEIFDGLKSANKKKEGDFLCRVALQFPDELLGDASEVCWQMQEGLQSVWSQGSQEALVFVLGDTTHGSCCVDMVAAQHLQADWIVHYGRACLSQIATEIPVSYVFGRGGIPLDLTDCVEKSLSTISVQKHSNIILLCDIPYLYAVDQLEILFRQEAQLTDMALNLLVAKPPRFLDSNNVNAATLLGGLQISLGDLQLKDFIILYVGCQDTLVEQRHLTNILLRCSGQGDMTPRALWVYNPSNRQLTIDATDPCSRTIQQRFYCVQKAKTALVFGIVISNQSQQHVIRNLQHLIESRNRSSYTFAVGKINPAKLANFGDVIDCFILVACPEHSLLSNPKDYPIPIITPLECLMALGVREWDGCYSLDTNDFLSHGDPSYEPTDNSDDDAPFFDVTTGEYVAMPRAKAKRTTHSSADENAEALVVSCGQQLIEAQSAAVQIWKNREYQGLQSKIGETAVHAAKPGMHGIASDFGEQDNILKKR